MSVVRLFEAKELAAALNAAGHQVSARTVQRWKAGEKDPKPQDLAAIRRLVVPDYEPATAPDWAVRLAVRLRAHSAKLEINDEDLRLAEAQEAAEEALRAGGAGRLPRRTAAARGVRAP